MRNAPLLTATTKKNCVGIIYINVALLFFFTEHRRHKKLIETFATTLPDYTILPERLNGRVRNDDGVATFCVEIKPKQGFVDNKLSVYSGKCDYCRKQCTKVSNDVSVRTSPTSGII